MKRLINLAIGIIGILLIAGCANSDSNNGNVIDVSFENSGNASTYILPSPEPSDEWNIETQDTDFTYYHDNFTLNIAPARDDLLAAFEYIHEMDYYEVRGFLQGDRIVIWANIPLRDFEVVNVRDDFVDGEWFFIAYGSYGRVDLLMPGQAFVINNYVGMGTLPHSGFTFLDTNNRRHHFAMQHNQSDSPNVFVVMQIDVDN